MLFGQEKICNHFNQSYAKRRINYAFIFTLSAFRQFATLLGLNYLYNILVVIHILCYKTSNLELSYIVRTNYEAHYF